MYGLAFGKCIGCEQVFGYNPDFVPSVVVDGVRKAVCRSCVMAANPERIKNGLAPIEIHSQAYEPFES
jgi:hypothetical protein